MHAKSDLFSSEAIGSLQLSLRYVNREQAVWLRPQSSEVRSMLLLKEALEAATLPPMSAPRNCAPHDPSMNKGCNHCMWRAALPSAHWGHGHVSRRALIANHRSRDAAMAFTLLYHHCLLQAAAHLPAHKQEERAVTLPSVSSPGVMAQRSLFPPACPVLWGAGRMLSLSWHRQPQAGGRALLHGCISHPIYKIHSCTFILKNSMNWCY